MRGKAISLPFMVCFLSACGSYRPEEGQEHWRQIRWSRDYAEAQERAQKEDKPILVILVSGDLEADC